MSAKVTTIGIVVLVLFAAFVGVNQAAVHDASPTAPEAPSVKGELKAFYEVNGESGHSDKGVLCSVIEFHPEYLVIKEKLGGGEVLPLAQIHSFRWEGK